MHPKLLVKSPTPIKKIRHRTAVKRVRQFCGREGEEILLLSLELGVCVFVYSMLPWMPWSLSRWGGQEAGRNFFETARKEYVGGGVDSSINWTFDEGHGSLPRR